jgi:hypothetical protein
MKKQTAQSQESSSTKTAIPLPEIEKSESTVLEEIPTDLARFLEISRNKIPAPALLPDELAAVEAAQTRYGEWINEGGKFSKSARRMRGDEIRSQMSADPAKLISLAGELAALESDKAASAAEDNARLGMCRVATEIQPTILAAYDREIARIEPLLIEVAAINLSKLGLSGQATIDKIAGELNYLKSFRSEAAEYFGPTVGRKRSPLQMAGGLIR